ncbi:MAG TPA: hypothetical protein VIY08_10475 [Candidatus Nitrosocosmicus sp.]
MLSQIVQSNRYQDLLSIKKEERYFTQARRKDILLSRIRLRLNNRGYILHKIGYKKGRKHDYDIYKNNHPDIPKQVIIVVDLGYLGIENRFPRTTICTTV